MKKIELEQLNEELKNEIKYLQERIMKNQHDYEDHVKKIKENQAKELKKKEEEIYHSWKQVNGIFFEKMFEEMISNLSITAKTSGGGYIDLILKYKEKEISSEMIQVEMNRCSDEY